MVLNEVQLHYLCSFHCTFYTLYTFGDNYIRVIPVPMPNTEVKPYVPKILANFFAGKIGHRQILYSSLAQLVERSAVEQV